MKPGKLFIVSACSGAGKSTIVDAVIEETKNEYAIERVITYTTKEPRPGEVNGQHYHFISSAVFREKIAQNFFLEWSDAYGHMYGSPRFIVNQMEQGKSYILVADRDGARQISSQIKGVVLIWIYTQNFEILEYRLRARKTEKEKHILARLALARQEIIDEEEKRLYHHHVLNDDLEKAVQEVKTKILLQLK